MSNIATRDSYGKELVELGKNDNVVVLNADLSSPTRTSMFEAVYPERHINCGIAEANMVGVAAGLATTGYVPFVSTFAMFSAGRAFEQIRNSIAYPKLNVKIGATHAGISVGEDGATHQCCEDIALMRVVPNMVVINPADDVEAKAAVRAAYEYQGPVYLRFGRLAIPTINNEEEYKFEIGKGVLLEEGNDVSIIATGLEVREAIVARKMLLEDGYSVRLINIHTIKPIDKDIILESLKYSNKIVTVEEHSIIGGLGSAVEDVVSRSANVEVLKIGVEDTFGESGNAEKLLQKYGLDSEAIYLKTKKFLEN